MSNDNKLNSAVYKANATMRHAADGRAAGDGSHGPDASANTSEASGHIANPFKAPPHASRRKGKTRDDRPSVRINANDPTATLRELEEKLREQRHLKMYRRGTDVVYLCDLREESANPAGGASIILIPATPDTVMTYFESISRFQKKRDGSGWRNCPMPRWLAQRFLALPDRTGLPVLKGLAPCPTLRPDGSLLAEPGYDAQTKLYLIDGIDVTVPDKPTEEEVRAALNTLRAFPSTFPFAGKEHGDLLAESVAIAAILRPCLPTMPAIGFTAPVRGSGKSYLANLIAVIVTGGKMPSVTVSARVDEFEKALGAFLYEAHPILSLDNVEVPLKGALLAEAITEPDVRIRVLGRSKMVQIPPVSAIFATGNNLQIHGDLTRRFLICQLDPGMERPEERKFSRDLLAEASERRGELISAALTVARYSLRLDPRDYDGGFPGFQDWYRRVALPLVALGMPDPVKSLDLARATDCEAEALEQLMTAWWAQHGDQEMICKDVVDTASVTFDEALKAVAADQTGEPCTQRLGQYLSRVQNRIVAGKRFVRLPKRGEGVRWRLEHVSSPSQ